MTAFFELLTIIRSAEQLMIMLEFPTRVSYNINDIRVANKIGRMFQWAEKAI